MQARYAAAPENTTNLVGLFAGVSGWRRVQIVQNVTIVLDERTAAWRRIQAATQNVSASRFVGQMLHQKRTGTPACDETMRRFLNEEPLEFSWAGGRHPTREALHVRDAHGGYSRLRVRAGRARTTQAGAPLRSATSRGGGTVCWLRPLEAGRAVRLTQCRRCAGAVLPGERHRGAERCR